MRTRWILILGLLLPLALPAQQAQQQILKLMGSRFEFTAIADTDTLAWAAIQAGIAEVTRIERLISSWDPNSQTSTVNRNAGIRPVVVDAELLQLIVRAKKVSALTDGAFDISFAAMDKIWVFDGTMQQLPAPDAVAAARRHIDWQKIRVNTDSSTVFLPEQGMKIGFGAIGKGYAANRAKAIMQQMSGVRGGVVNAGGDLITWGASIRPEGWTVTITDPRDKAKAIAWLPVQDMAVVTSGDYERFVTFDGKRYAHIIDPRTGYPTTGIKSVTILCPDAELADALATSVFVLGTDRGLALIDQLKGVACLIVTDADELRASQRLQLNLY